MAFSLRRTQHHLRPCSPHTHTPLDSCSCSCSCAGSLEEWLQEVASQAQFTLRSMAPACLAAAAGATRARWALDWPPQLVLACARAMWTSEVEAARKRGGRALAIVAERCVQAP